MAAYGDEGKETLKDIDVDHKFCLTFHNYEVNNDEVYRDGNYGHFMSEFLHIFGKENIYLFIFVKLQTSETVQI